MILFIITQVLSFVFPFILFSDFLLYNLLLFLLAFLHRMLIVLKVHFNILSHLLLICRTHPFESFLLKL